ncbi:MAG: PAS domain S-box protein [Ignavibacteriae bacterium]|nr:PAS domain S-box protein [Ignavibacteriota bacterium]
MKPNEMIINKIDSFSQSELKENSLKLQITPEIYTNSFDIIKLNEFNRLIVENSQDGIMIIDDEFKIEYANNRIFELTGLTKELIINQDFTSVFNSIDLEMFFNNFNSDENKKFLSSIFELPISVDNNQQRIIEISNTKLKDSEGNAKILSQIREINFQKNTAEEIKQSEEKFRSIVENSHLGIVIIDMDYKFEYVNDQFCKILHSTKEKLTGTDFRKILSKDSAEIVSERYIKRQQGIETPSEYEIKLVRNDGEERNVKLSSSIVNFSGKIKTIAQILDITEFTRKEKLQSAILKISQAVNEVNNLRDFLKIVREELSTILDTTNFYVALYDKNTDAYTFPYFVDEFDKYDELTQLELKDSLTDYVRRKKEAILVNNNMQTILESEGEIKGIVGSNCPVWLGAPLVVNNQAVGVVVVQNYYNENTYNETDLELLKLVSENVSSAIWKKQIIDKLTESELRYRDFISRSSEGIYRIDFDPPILTTLSDEEQVAQILKFGNIGECNNSFAKMHDQQTYKDIVGKNLNIFYGNKITDQTFKYYLDFVNSSYKTIDSETTKNSANEEQISFLNNSIGIIKDGFLLNIWGIQKDITESKKLQNILKQIAEGVSSSIGDTFFRSLVNFLGETLKVDFTFIAKLSEDKKTADSLASWQKDKLVDNFSYKLKNSPSKFILERNVTTLISDVQKDFPNDESLKNLNIKSYMGRPLIDSKGKIIGIIVIMQQGKIQNVEFTKSVLEIFASRSSQEIERLNYVKEIVESKEQAERSNKLKSDFLAQMSHEIRTPVNTILSFASLVRESLEHQLDEDLKDSFKIIENGGRRLIRTIDLILNVSQIQSGSLILTPTKLNLVTILEDLIAEFKQSAIKKNLELILESSHPKLNLYADLYTLTQIFANLIHNAIKYTNNGSVRLVAVKTDQKEIIVEVIDSGVGMSEKYLTELFDPFSQEETGYTRKFEGTGLGLTLVRKYCELNNAEIIVQSRKNEGSTFTIKFKK